MMAREILPEGLESTGTVALVDCRAFYASVQAVFEPRLKRVPLVVLSNNDGSVVALNDGARALGIDKGVPFFELRELMRTTELQVRSSNFELYGDVSRRVMVVLAQFSPSLEIYSIDEAFLDTSHVPPEHRQEFGRDLQRTVYQATGIPVRFSVGATKTLAKAASWLAKHDPAADGLFDLSAHPTPDAMLATVPVAQVWGVGRRWAQMLTEAGIETALTLREVPREWARKRMSIVGLRTVLELRGIACLPLELAPPARKSLVVSRSFGKPVTTQARLVEAVATFIARGARTLRREDLVVAAVSVFAQSSPHRPEQFYSRSATAMLSTATSHTPLLLKCASRLVGRVWREGVLFAKAGIMLTGISSAGAVQLSLFGVV